MIHYLLLFQFTLLYWLIIVVGLIVYGSDFASAAGKLYLLPLLGLPLLHRFIHRFARGLASPWPAALILLCGAVLALLAYQPLHFGYWDEHSNRQALLLALLGVFSYLASVVASVRLRHWQGNHQRAVAMTWLLLGLVWMFAVAYPMVALLAMAMILAVASVWSVPVAQALPVTTHAMPMPAGVLKYLMFLLVLDLGLVIWDYQVDSRWAWYLGGAFITAAVGSWLALVMRRRLFWPVVALACINFIAAIMWPAFVIHPLHSVLIGLCLGWVVGYVLQSDEGPNPEVMFALSVPLFLGLITGYLFYANLAYVTWRTLLLVPLVALLLRKPAMRDKAAAV